MKENKNLVVTELISYLVDENGKRYFLLEDEEANNHNLSESDLHEQENSTPLDNPGVEKIKKRKETELEIARFHAERLQNLQMLLDKVAISTLNLDRAILVQLLRKQYTADIINKIKEPYLRNLLSLYLKELMLLANYCTKHNIARHGIYILA